MTSWRNLPWHAVAFLALLVHGLVLASHAKAKTFDEHGSSPSVVMDIGTDIVTDIVMNIVTFYGHMVGGATNRAASGSPNTGIVETRLDDLVKHCLETYTLYWGPPLFHDRDFCAVLGANMISGKDVSRRAGLQLDIIDIIRQIRPHLMERKRDLNRAIARDLLDCTKNFRPRASIRIPDSCLVTPSEKTADIWEKQPGRKADMKLWDVLRGVWKLLYRTSYGLKSEDERST